MLALLLAACAHVPPTPPAPAVPSMAALQDRFAAAVQDASQPQADEIRTNLVALVPGGPGTEWDSSGRVMVSTWTSYTGYPAAGQDTTVSRDIFVTSAAEFRAACAAWTGRFRAGRMEQLLGLPLDTSKTLVVAFWADPSALFRPCPDAEVTDTACQLDFPPGTTDAHRAWIEDLRSKSYGTDGYPWTQLGYTYDWGKDDEQGLSEFVLASGSTVTVAWSGGLDELCKGS